MGHQFEMGYLGLQVDDPEALGAYLRDVLGLQLGSPPGPDVEAWRLDGKAGRLFVHRGPANNACYIGYVAVDDDAYDACVTRLQSSGATVTEATPADTAARCVAKMAYTHAPWGTRVEIAMGLADAPTPFESVLVPGGFVTDGVGLGHAVFFIAGDPEEHAEATRFVEDGLGMVLSDYLDMGAGEDRFRANFYHCNARHHTLALGFVEAPTSTAKLHHLMVETVSVDNVGMAFDRAVAAGVPIPSGLGKHPNDRMFSFYSRTPAGFEVEFGTGGAVVDDSWPVVQIDRVSVWGHQPFTPTTT